MRFVACIAVFHYRRMFPKEGAAPFRVALIAGLIDCGRDQHLRIRPAMRVVAGGARHQSLAEWHMRGALQLRTAHRMTFETEFHLSPRRKERIRGERLLKTRSRDGRRRVLVDLVAPYASETSRLMRAALPEHPLAFLMALQAAGVQLLSGNR
jgi:hypothetical protein